MEDNNVSTANFATVHFYRTKSIFGAAIKPNLLMKGNPKPIATIKRNWKKTITMPAGSYAFTATTEATNTLQLQVEAGKEYYVKCAIGLGLLVGRMNFTLMDAATAEQKMKGLREED